MFVAELCFIAWLCWTSIEFVMFKVFFNFFAALSIGLALEQTGLQAQTCNQTIIIDLMTFTI